MGAQVIEKHVCLDRTIDNPDAAFSMEIGEFAQMVQDVRNACVIKGKATYELTEHEKSSLKYQRSLVGGKTDCGGGGFPPRRMCAAPACHRYQAEVLPHAAGAQGEKGVPLRRADSSR